MRYFFVFLFSALSFGHYAIITEPLQTLDLDSVTSELRADEAERQEAVYPGSVSGERAVTLALVSFLNDGSDALSPLRLAQEFLGGESVSDAKDLLMAHLNRSSTQIRFLWLDEKPAKGSPLSQAWAISLEIPSLSGHRFEAIVDRKGEEPTYHYGVLTPQ